MTHRRIDAERHLADGLERGRAQYLIDDFLMREQEPVKVKMSDELAQEGEASLKNT